MVVPRLGDTQIRDMHATAVTSSCHRRASSACPAAVTHGILHNCCGRSAPPLRAAFPSCQRIRVPRVLPAVAPASRGGAVRRTGRSMSSPRAAKGNQEEAAPTAALKMGNTAVTALAKLIPVRTQLPRTPPYEPPLLAQHTEGRSSPLR
jgi:hypothetical protein